MDVAADGDWGVNRHDIAFFDQELSRFEAEFADGGFGDDLAGAEVGDVPGRRERLDNVVYERGKRSRRTCLGRSC